MKDLYIKPEVELKQFDAQDVIICSPSPAETTGKSGDSQDPNWSITV